MNTKIFPFVILFVINFVCFNCTLVAQETNVTVSGKLMDNETKELLPFVNVVLKTKNDSAFVVGTISFDDGVFTLEKVEPNSYLLSINAMGYESFVKEVFIGANSPFLNLGNILLFPLIQTMGEVQIVASEDEINSKMDKKTYKIEDNLSQTGGSVLQALENLPGITIVDNKVQLRGSDKIIVLIDGKQSALTGNGGQSGLDNIPASSIESIEIINNPSSKYDANGNAGIINIILKKEKKEGFNGKIGMAAGLGALWIKKENLPGIRPQYQYTPKINPSISLNYRKNKVNTFLQVDNLYTQTLNKNEFVTRTYDDGTIIYQQTKRNRNTNFFTSKVGLDWFIDDNNSFTISGLYGSEKILDYGDQPFFNNNNERVRLWQFLEDELKTTVISNMSYQHKFQAPGRVLNTSASYTFHREDEQYFFDNYLPNYTGREAFKLISDENVADFNLDFTNPLKYGKIEMGTKIRYRNIPTNMQFFPSAMSPLDSSAGGKATYNEIIPAVFANYLFDSKKWEGEVGLRVEYVKVDYQVNPNHPVYKTSGYSYTQPFPNLRLSYKLNDNNRLSAFFNRRVDRPNEVDIRIFPKYDDAEIIKVGNPSLRPQFTNSLELAYKNSFKKGYWYSSAYHKFATGTITRISTITDSSNLIYAVFQNAGKSSISGIESVFSHDISKFISYNLGINVYYNFIDSFSVVNIYPEPTPFSTEAQSIYSGNAKLNMSFHFKKDFDLQLTSIYLAPDIIPQGTTNARFSLNLGMKKTIQKGQGQLFLNASDLLNTMVVKKNIRGNGFSYTSADYYETQVIRIGYSFKF